ncbi:MAG: tRNA pseudouridine(38-40) synthase TruA [Candidatus Omnitrophica bacterium]|nr:tRNA pseudouridine(38-40) synthase TruA [Candidatus Omnitrophota bacterium]
MLRTIKITIEYDGTNFSGWQMQAKRFRTVQGEIEASFTKIFKKRVPILGSGRTDSGVHALGQVAHFRISSPMPLEKLHKALNGTLPADIVITKIEEVDKDFHAQYSVKEKTYRYTILNREVRSSVNRNICLLFPYDLNVALMRSEAKCLVGKQDFKSFQNSDVNRKDESTVRTVKALTIKKTGDIITIDITANGFLYKMVRNIVGTLLAVGTGKLPKGSVKRILTQKDRTMAPETAKPQGLCLVSVKY